MSTILVLALLLGVAHVSGKIASPGNETQTPEIIANLTSTGVDEDKKIVGGYPTTIEEFPYQVQLEENGKFLCGGSLIGTRRVLTAAHCTVEFPVEEITVRVGSSFMGSGGQVRKAFLIREHPFYNKNTLDNDIAVIRLNDDFILGPGVKRIPFATSGQDPPAGTWGTVSGWGATSAGGQSPDQLRAVEVPILARNVCRNVVGPAITRNMFCAGFPQGGKDACQGDSGGPLVIREGGIRILEGVVSWGKGCADAQSPGVYTKVSNYVAFIGL